MLGSDLADDFVEIGGILDIYAPVGIAAIELLVFAAFLCVVEFLRWLV